MALLNTGVVVPPFAVMWCIIELAPADSPMTVMAVGSPPRYEMYFCVHCRAASWSSRPTFAVPPLFCKVGPAKKPNAPSCISIREAEERYSVICPHINDRVIGQFKQWFSSILILGSKNYLSQISLSDYQNLHRRSKREQAIRIQKDFWPPTPEHTHQETSNLHLLEIPSPKQVEWVRTLLG